MPKRKKSWKQRKRRSEARKRDREAKCNLTFKDWRYDRWYVLCDDNGGRYKYIYQNIPNVLPKVANYKRGPLKRQALTMRGMHIPDVLAELKGTGAWRPILVEEE